MFGIGKKKTEETSWITKLKTGLHKSSDFLGNGLKDILIKRKLDQDMLEQLEDLLVLSDIGIKTSQNIVNELAKTRFDKEISEDDVKSFIAGMICTILQPYEKQLKINITNGHKPNIILVCGVNGSGKTTTIGKYAAQLTQEGKKVVIAACDTFRAAAIDQLAVWADRANCKIITGKEGSDPASVAFNAISEARESGADVVIIDTAGRLQNKTNLMDQLVKIKNVIKKLDETAPHESIIVLDATTGQNAHNQIKIFKEFIDISGIIITKLDGTARGGVVVALAQEFFVPIYAIGIGEKIDDLRNFNAEQFAKALVGV